MITAAEIAAALDGAKVSNLAVARKLGVAPERVRRVRAKEGVPVYPRGRRGSGESWAEAFAARTLAVDGGHLDWTGPLSEHGTPVLRLGRAAETAYRYAFRVHHGREAEGKAGPACGFPGVWPVPTLRTVSCARSDWRRRSARACGAGWILRPVPHGTGMWTSSPWSGSCAGCPRCRS